MRQTEHLLSLQFTAKILVRLPKPCGIFKHFIYRKINARAYITAFIELVNPLGRRASFSLQKPGYSRRLNIAPQAVEVALKHERKAQAVFADQHFAVMLWAEALRVCLYPNIGLHHGCAQNKVELVLLQLGIKGAKGAARNAFLLALALHMRLKRFVYRYGVNGFHKKSFLKAVYMINNFKIKECENYIEISGIRGMSAAQTFDCGQCFRFDADQNGIFFGVAMGRYVGFEQPSSDVLRIYNASIDDFNEIWCHYLALDADYANYRDDIASRFVGDKTMAGAMECGAGIRLLRQDRWETVCSFIVSQNNNIPRIKKIIAAMSERFGVPIETPFGTKYAFPTARALYEAGEAEIFALKTGFRAKYIYDAARRVCDGSLDLDAVYAADTDAACNMLMTVKGIGLKVASCALLFGFDKTDVFPVDVWIRRVLDKYYPDGIEISRFGPYAGLAQQYLFYYERYMGGMGD